jgi:hypothetical protein
MLPFTIHRTMRPLMVALLFLMVSASIAEAQRTELPCINKKFSMVVHIVRDSLGEPGISEGDITGQVDYLNTLWDTICVSFEVCEFRYIDNFQWDSLEALGGYRWNEMLTAHEQEQRINIFYVSKIIEPPETAGFATLGGIGSSGGSICMTKGGGSGTLAHEMGHFWGLPHTFENPGQELANGSNCTTAGDQLCDTPADPYSGPGITYVTDCVFTWMGLDPNGEFYDPDIGNIMSYYDCTCHFSYQQYQKMAATFLNGGSPGGYVW